MEIKKNLVRVGVRTALFIKLPLAELVIYKGVLHIYGYGCKVRAIRIWLFAESSYSMKEMIATGPESLKSHS